MKKTEPVWASKKNARTNNDKQISNAEGFKTLLIGAHVLKS